MAMPNIVLNTIVAESLRHFADELDGAVDFTTALNNLLQTTIRNHRRIIFNGNGYSDRWIEEAARRGLHNIPSSVDAIACYTSPESIELFARHGVFSAAELTSRRDIYCDNYSKIIHIEALTMIDMVKRSVVPAVAQYATDLANSATALMDLNPSLNCSMQTCLAAQLTDLSADMYSKLAHLEATVCANGDCHLTPLEQAQYHRNSVFMAMQDLRTTVDKLESIVSADLWPFPTYGEMLFSV